MSGKLDQFEATLKAIAADAQSPDAIKIIDTLTKEVERLRGEVITAHLPAHHEVTAEEIKRFKDTVYENLKGQRATDLVLVYNRRYLSDYKAVTILAMVEVLSQIASEQKVSQPELWQRLIDSSGHL